MREGSPAARADQKREGERDISIKSSSESLRQKHWRGKKTSLSDASFTQAWKWICLFVKQLCASIHAIDSYFNQHHKAIPLFSLSHSVIGAMLMTSAVISDFLLIFIWRWPEQWEVELWELQCRAPICPDSILIWIIRKFSDSKGHFDTLRHTCKSEKHVCRIVFVPAHGWKLFKGGSSWIITDGDLDSFSTPFLNLTWKQLNT